MTQTLVRRTDRTPQEIPIEQALVMGDLSKLDAEQRVNYYLKVCSSLGLNPLTRPFDYLVLNNKLVLYARKDATDQLRHIHKVSITRLEREQLGDLLVVTASATAADGRRDTSIGAVNVKGLQGEALANAMMRAETKSKRRVTLSLCGLGMTDESEVDSIPGAYYPEPDSIDVTTREQTVDERDLVRSADERVWQSYERGLAEARGLGLNPVVAALPIDRDELRVRIRQLKADVDARQEQIDKDEVERQRRQEGLV